MKIYLDVIKKDSGCIVAYHHLGLLYSKKGEWELSQKYFDVAIKKAPKNIDLLCDVGYSYYLQHRDQEAEVCLRRAIALDTDNGLAHNNLGLLLARLGRQDDGAQGIFPGRLQPGPGPCQFGAGLFDGESPARGPGTISSGLGRRSESGDRQERLGGLGSGRSASPASCHGAARQQYRASPVCRAFRHTPSKSRHRPPSTTSSNPSLSRLESPVRSS